MSEETTTYFQYFKDLGYPIFLEIELSQFEQTQAENFLNNCMFSKIDKKQFEQLVEEHPKTHRVLRIKRASARALKQIGRRFESDRYGSEKLINRDGFQIYRMQGNALLIFSLRASIWEMAVTKAFGSDESLLNNRIVLARYLSWAFSSLGVCGFWGTAVDEGVVISNAKDSFGEAVFYDIHNQIILTLDGYKQVDQDFAFIRLDSALIGKSKQLRPEELLSFLSTHTTYFAFNGLPIPLRQMIQTLAKENVGYVIPKANFLPRSKTASA